MITGLFFYAENIVELAVSPEEDDLKNKFLCWQTVTTRLYALVRWFIMLGSTYFFYYFADVDFVVTQKKYNLPSLSQFK